MAPCLYSLHFWKGQLLEKKEISNDFKDISYYQKTLQNEEFLDDKCSVTPARLERATNGLKGQWVVEDLRVKVCSNCAMFLSIPV